MKKILLVFALIGCWIASAQFSFHSPSFVGSLKVGIPRVFYTPPATDFNALDYLNRGAGLTGASDGKVGIVAFWIKYHNDSEVDTPVFIGNYPAGGFSQSGIVVYRGAQARMFVDGYNSAGSVILRRKTLSGGAFSFIVANGWMHFMASWDLAAGVCRVYINGANAEDSESAVTTDDTLDYTQSDWAFGAFQDGTQKMNACVSEFYLNMAEFADLSDYSTRTRWYNDGAVNLGSDGSTPTGTAPIVFLKNSSATFHINAGTGGDFTVTGTLTACSDTPH